MRKGDERLKRIGEVFGNYLHVEEIYEIRPQQCRPLRQVPIGNLIILLLCNFSDQNFADKEGFLRHFFISHLSVLRYLLRFSYMYNACIIEHSQRKEN